VASYHIGELLNQFNWHGQQAALLQNKDHHTSQTLNVLINLALATRDLFTAPREELQNFILEEPEKWSTWLGSLGQLRCWAPADDPEEESQSWDNNDESPESAIYTDHDLLRISYGLVLREHRLIYQRIRAAIEKPLDDASRVALHLGEAIDQGLRRQDVIWFMHAPEVPVIHGEYISTQSIEPGQIPPRYNWLAIVEKLWSELGIPRILPSTISQLLHSCQPIGPVPQPLKEILSQIGPLAREGLEELTQSHAPGTISATPEQLLSTATASRTSTGDHGRAGENETTAGPGKRGRPADSDPNEDKRISDAWDSGSYKTEAELARELGITKRKVTLARDRHRKRQERAQGKRRTKSPY
jgi:hypothetical protein